MGGGVYGRWSAVVIGRWAVVGFALWAVCLPSQATSPPQTLSETGLYRDIAMGVLADDVHGFTPQYPLWSDGARKRRWIRLPAGSQIDARVADAWVFPIGTRLWKEFSHQGRLETRMIERLADGQWRFTSYVWRADGRDADLAPAVGTLRPADGSDAAYAVPSQNDCLACHDGAPAPVLGFSALQLSVDRDPNAVHAERPGPADLNLARLIERGWLANWQGGAAPRIAVREPLARAALGYLHGNCGHCHHRLGDGAVPVDLDLAQSVASIGDWLAPVPAALLANSPRFADDGGLPRRRADVLLARMQSTTAAEQMPPLGRQHPDLPALALIQRWLATETSRP